MKPARFSLLSILSPVLRLHMIQRRAFEFRRYAAHEIHESRGDKMLNNSNVVAFVATSRPEQAKSFYEQTLGLRFVKEDDFAIVFDANGIMLRVQKVQAHTPPPYTVLGWDVSDRRARRSY